ncbi:MAG: Tol-Pal system protein TolB [Alphaproteobacteria bacterium]|nr:Tol-Pal system protein TolB [Alphaproteobacteria bacterium]
MKKSWWIAALALVVLVPGMSHAALRIDITKGVADPLPIAIPDLPSNNEDGADFGRRITQVIANDLSRSGLFRPLDKGSFIEKITYPPSMPRFADWKGIGAQALVTGSVTVQGNDLKVIFMLWDVLGGQAIGGKEFTAPKSSWRRVAHIVADEIYKRITGEEGYFDTRVVYVAETGPARRRVKRLAIMDQDGENHQFLTDGRALVLTPRFSPDTQQILYMSYARGKPAVYLRDLASGREEMLGNFEGMSFAPRFGNDRHKVLMSIAANGVTSIYEMNLRTRQQRKLTNDSSINTSPSYSPDGRSIVFNSDRGGSQQLYVMDADGGNVRRISFGDGRYGTPVWSPRGDLIAYTKMQGGRFYIGVMRTDGSGERVLSEGYMVEGPTWAPNGRVIMFTRQERGAQSRLYSIDLTGANERQVMTPIEASDPAWSPLLSK